jgi:molybdate transport system substrate-binding protein
VSRPLSLYLPGAFANLAEDLRAGFANIDPVTELVFHRFVPSGDLAALILLGAEADVFVSANRRFMDDVAQAGLAIAPRVLGGNRLCIIGNPGQTAGIADVPSLIASPLRIVVPQPETDPCGRYIDNLFLRLGLSDEIATRKAQGTLAYSHGSGDLPAFLDDDSVDAGILYFSETLALRERMDVIELPRDQDCRDQIAFYISLIVRNDIPHPTANAFVGWLTSSDGQARLAGAGFLPLTDLG